GGHSHVMPAAHDVLGIKFGELLGTVERHQIGEAVAPAFVEGAPMAGGAEHLGCRDAGQSFAGTIPDHHATARIDHEGRDDQVLHQPHGVGMREVRAFRASLPHVISRYRTILVRRKSICYATAAASLLIPNNFLTSAAGFGGLNK